MPQVDTVTFAWAGKRTEVLLDVLCEHGIGFQLNRDGVTVELAAGTTPQECRRLMEDAVERRIQKRRRKAKANAAGGRP